MGGGHRGGSLGGKPIAKWMPPGKVSGTTQMVPPVSDQTVRTGPPSARITAPRVALDAGQHR